jgi:hypothetical protein
MVPQLPDLAPLMQEIETVEAKGLRWCVESRKEPLEESIAFSLMLLSLKAIASTLNQIGKDLLH